MVICSGGTVGVYENTTNDFFFAAPPPVQSRLKPDEPAASLVSNEISFFPNPVKGEGTFTYNITSENVQVRLEVLDLSGRIVETLINNTVNEGDYTVTFNTEALSPGVYYYRFNTADQLKTGKIIVSK